MIHASNERVRGCLFLSLQAYSFFSLSLSRLYEAKQDAIRGSVKRHGDEIIKQPRAR